MAANSFKKMTTKGGVIKRTDNPCRGDAVEVIEAKWEVSKWQAN